MERHLNASYAGVKATVAAPAAAPAPAAEPPPEAAAPPQSIPANVESNPASSGSKGGVFYKPAVSISLGVLGLGAIAHNRWRLLSNGGLI